MSINLICPHLSCGKAVVAPDSARGKTVKCVHCGAQFLVPLNMAQQNDGDNAERPSKGAGSSKSRQ